MAKRTLRIVRSDPPGVLGVCEFCNEQFKSLAADLMDAVENIKDKFNAHTCKREDVKLDMAKRPRDPNQLAKPAKSDLYKKTISN